MSNPYKDLSLKVPLSDESIEAIKTRIDKLRDPGNQYQFPFNDETKEDDALKRLADAVGLRTPMGVAALKLAVRNVKLLDSKQLDYGSGNISAFGEFGVLVRASDKLERLKNLCKSTDKPKHEAVSDSWADLSNYGLIGELCHTGVWPGAGK